MHYLKGGTKGANSDNTQMKKKKIKRILYRCWFDCVPLPFGWNLNTFHLMCTDQKRLEYFKVKKTKNKNNKKKGRPSKEFQHPIWIPSYERLEVLAKPKDNSILSFYEK